MSSGQPEEMGCGRKVRGVEGRSGLWKRSSLSLLHLLLVQKPQVLLLLVAQSCQSSHSYGRELESPASKQSREQFGITMNVTAKESHRESHTASGFTT